MIPLLNRSEFKLTFNEPDKGIKIFSAMPIRSGQGKVTIELDKWVVEHLRRNGHGTCREKRKIHPRIYKTKTFASI